MKKIKEWLMESNRYKHVIGMLFVAAASILLLKSFDVAVMVCIMSTTLTCFFVGAAMEFKDQQAGGKFDWNDMLANGVGLVLAVMMLIIMLAL